MAQYTPFPTFGGPKEGGGIMNVKLSPTQMRFPTARRPANRQKVEPDLTEKIAPLLPFLFDGIGGILSSEKPMDKNQYLTSIGADPKNLNLLEQARGDAFDIYGAETKKDGFGFDDIVDIVTASQLGRGAPSFAQGTATMNRAKEQDRLSREAGRTSFIKSRLTDLRLANKPKGYGNVNLLSVSDHSKGIKGVYQGRENDETGELELLTEDGYIKAGPDYVKQTGTGNIAPPENPNVKIMDDLLDPLFAKEVSITNLVQQGSNTIRTLKEILEGDKLVPNTVTASLIGFGDRVRIEFDNLQKMNVFGTDNRYFASQKDVDDGKSGFRPETAGTGVLAENLWNAIQSGDTDEIEKASKLFETTFIDDKLNNPKGLTLREFMGDVVYDDVTLRSQMLSMAYTAAGVNGQTGRTLSDKDLAYHLQIVGFNQTSNPDVLIKNIQRFVGDAVAKVDGEAQLAIQQNWYKLKLDDPYVQSALKQYYEPPTSNVDLKDPSNPYNFIYPENFGQYKFRNLGTRYKNIGFDEFTGYVGNKNKTQTLIPTNVGELLDNVINNTQ